METKSIVVYDCEIVKAIPPKNGNKEKGIKYCEGWRDFENMGISVICAYDYLKDRYRVFMEDNLIEFQDLVDARDIICGFNTLAFDNKLCAANGIYVDDSKSYDILVEVWKARGLGNKFVPERAREYLGLGLEPLSEINFGQNKTGDGALAPVLWQQGRYGTVVDYCMQDVCLTKKLLDQILRQGILKDPHRDTRGALLTICSDNLFRHA